MLFKKLQQMSKKISKGDQSEKKAFASLFKGDVS